MEEIHELLRSLSHKSEACFLTSINKQRIHSYSMISGLAQLEARLMAKNEKEMAARAARAIQKCTLCIRSTAQTGKCFNCSKEDIKIMEKELEAEKASKWENIAVKK